MRYKVVNGDGGVVAKFRSRGDAVAFVKAVAVRIRDSGDRSIVGNEISGVSAIESNTNSAV